MFKKRWSDGLQDDFDHLNEFEFKLGCFGGDGGGSSGGGFGGNLGSSGYGDGDSDTGGMGSADEDTGFGEGGGGGNDAVSDALADALSNNIGDYSVDDTNVDMADTGQYGAEPSISSFADLQSQVSNLANQSLASKNSTAVADFQNQVASGMFASPPSAPPSYGTPASYGPNVGAPTGYSVGVPAMDLDIGINSPISDNLSGYTPTGTPTSVSDALAQALGINNNIAGFNIAPGMIGNAPGLIGTTKFREGGAVEYPGYGQSMSGGGGIMSVLEPFGNYLTEQIDTQRVDPFLETVSNAAYQEFGIKPDQGGGFFSGGFYKDGGSLPDRDIFGGGGMPHADEGFDFSNPFPNMPQPIYERPTPNFPEGLFGGGPLPNPDGRPQDDPVFGFGGLTPAVQNPGADNTNAFQVASLSNFGPDVGKGFDDLPQISQPGYGGQPMQLPYDPTPMNPLIMDSFVAAGGTLPDFSGSAQSYFNPGDGGQSAYGPIALSPDRLVQIAQGRLAQRDVKPPEVQAYLSHIVQTGGNPTMMAPPAQTNTTNLAGNLLSAGPMNMADAGNLAAFNLGTNPPPQPLTPASVVGGLVDEYGNPASFSPAQLEAMLAATPISSFQQGPNLNRGNLQVARSQFG